jgi:hypothetical protein
VELAKFQQQSRLQALDPEVACAPNPTLLACTRCGLWVVFGGHPFYFGLTAVSSGPKHTAAARCDFRVLIPPVLLQLRRKAKTASKGPAFLREAKQNAGVLLRDQHDREAALVDVVDLQRSRRALEAKAALYDRMQTHGMTPEESEQFLVDFEAKLDDEPGSARDSGAAAGPALAPPPPPPVEADDDWVSYKDAFGRDRRCHRRDLAARLTAEKDVLLGQSDGAPPPPPPPPPHGRGSEHGHRYAAAPDLMSTDMRREMERQQWEADALAATQSAPGPVGQVHFQAVVPGEIRQLGTGYYNFSTDAEQRATQMESLSTLRDQTSEQRRRRDALKKRRQAAQSARINKIKKRKGLPVCEPADSSVAEGAPAAPDTGAEGSTVDELLAFYKTQSAQSGSM